MTKDFSTRKLVGRVLHLGAGRQSSTIAEMIVEGDLPTVDLVVFADTGDEPPWVYLQVAYLAKRLSSVNIPLHIARATGEYVSITDAAQSGKRSASFPLYMGTPGKKSGMLRRQCTNEWKIIPANSVVLDWMLSQGHAKRRSGDGRRRVDRKVYIEQWFGISTDESIRAKERGPKWQKFVYPLIDLMFSTDACFEYLLSKGLPIPKKSSCIVCPYHDDEYWLDLKNNHSELFGHACLFDSWLRSESAGLSVTTGRLKKDAYLHSSCLPLSDVPFDELVQRKRLRFSAITRRILDEEIQTGRCSVDGGFSCFS